MVKKTVDTSEDTGEEVVADEGETVGTQNDARLAMLNQINDSIDESRADELVEIDDAGQVTQFVHSTEEGEPPVPSDDNGTTETELERMADEANAEPPITVPKFKIKVNGKELELTQDELIERAQKVEAADAYLAEAARIRQQAKESNQPKPPPKEDVEANDLEERRKLARAIQMGTEEEAIEAIAKLQSRGPSVTADDMARTVDERLNFKEAASKFESEFKDIMSDPVLRKMVLDKDLEALRAGDKRDYYTRYVDIGTEVRNWKENLLKSAAPPPAPPKSPTQEKLDRKSSAAPVPKVANAKTVAPVEEDEAEETPSAVIANMAKSRGGPQWMRS